MKKLLLTFFLLSFPALFFANGKNVLSLLMKDGTTVYFFLEEKPMITFVNDDVSVVCDSEEVTVKRSLVDHFEFVTELPSGIEEVEETENEVSTERIELTHNVIQICGLVPGGKVQLYSINGQALHSSTANGAGIAILSIASLPEGIYIVNYNEQTIKFIKR